MNKNNYVVIMAGGVGTRFWPFSRTNNPKQFHDVLGTGRTLLQQTADRFENICPNENIYIVTSADYIDLIKTQLPFLSDSQILAEPIRRNTAPCVAYACYKIGKQNPDANIVVAPADHIILKENEFEKRINIALETAASGDVLVTLGITPTRPDTGYGYIQYDQSETEVKRVKTFREKPNLELAKAFIESGDYVWNAGIFIWTAKAIKKAFADNSPAVHSVFEAGNDIYYTEQETDFINEIYQNCESISIDYAIMEKAENVFTVLGNIGWSDLGTWKSLYEVSDKDEDANVIDGATMLYDVKNSIIKTPKDRLVVIQGLDGYIVAEYDNVLMICEKEQEQFVKSFVADATKKGKEFV
ncbi:mannose-1-phosphate guanylyltransferase [Arcicella aquatica]|uniref:Mannose-1-phosphate guanylyltransferase n=1 Tax=Arcicella aquatica TaxID=217141 RepID=A0ABU5QJ23_9BACT|nr:mannose-1-phosphate guanylyltransferase [Arcicella aquatica]MEA5257057.1 mannose-1-phosphate guanylyltransferase [Arcicella aquatica]